MEDTHLDSMKVRLPETVEPPPDDLNILKKCLRYRKEGYTAKKNHTEEWKSLKEFTMGGQLSPRMPRYRVRAIQNFVFGLIERKAALLTDTSPIIRINTTLEHADSDLRQRMAYCAKALELYIQNLWSSRSLGVKFFDFFQLAEIFGSCGINIIYSPRVGKSGGIDLKVVDPRVVMVDPNIGRWYNLQSAEYLIYEELWATEEVEDFFRRKVGRGSYRYTEEEQDESSLFSKICKMFGFDRSETYQAIDRTVLSEFWIKDRTRGADGLPLYPNGRHLIIANCAGPGTPVLLLDEPNPYMDGNFPIEFMDWHFHFDSVWGFGDVALYRSTQALYNKMVALLVENAMLVNNAMWVGEKTALDPEEWNKLTTAPGLIVKVNPGKTLNRVGPAPFSADYVGMLSYLLQSMDKLSGLTSVLEGTLPSREVSGVAIENLQSAAQVIIRAKARQFEDLLQRLGQRLISRIFQYIEDNRIMAVTGDEKLTLAYHAERERIRKYPRTYWNDYRFEVVPGSTLSISRWQKGLMAAQLHGMGIIDAKAVLDAMEYPNRDEIMERVALAKEAEMKLQIALSQQLNPDKAVKPKLSGQGGRRSDQVPRKVLSDPELKLQQKAVPGHPDVQGVGF